MIARLQFATAASIHFLFVILTLGLVTLLVYLQTAWFLTGKPVYERLTRFWGLLYVINYVLGIAAGIVMEFQFGLNWSGLSRYIGNVFGAPLAMETLAAFFLESTLLGMWIFGWQRLRRGVHLALIWVVALTAYMSAFWIMVGNSFMQNPVGHEVRDGAAYLTDVGALLTNGALWFAFGHIVSAALTTGGIVMAAISSWHFIRRTTEWEFFRKSLRLGLVTAMIGVSFVIAFGIAQFVPISRYQPTKFSPESPQSQLLVAAWTAQFGPGDYIRPGWIGLPLAFMILIAVGMFFSGLVGLPMLAQDWFIKARFPLYAMQIALPLPFIAVILGWLVREVGRQPWVAYGLLPISQAVTPASRGEVLASYIAFTVLLLGLAVADWVLIAKAARRGPFTGIGVPLDPEPESEPAIA